ncbi:MAG: glycosyltransferase, partial [Oscillospiraceae bacterium]|nr:glycosyltransferase [Oscillospiraceae bacterium]
MISVIVPVYNTEKFLDKCIESISKQTFDDFEIILVDDGSTDKSGQICDTWAHKDNRVKVIHKQNAGVSAARNNGIAAAKGEYIAFVDSDDTVSPDYLRLLH